MEIRVKKLIIINFLEFIEVALFVCRDEKTAVSKDEHFESRASESLLSSPKLRNVTKM